MGSSITHLLWLDLETNGHEAGQDGEILEIGVVATEANKYLSPLWDLDRLIHDNPFALLKMPAVVDKMHTKNGLKAAWQNTPQEARLFSFDVEKVLLNGMSQAGANAKWAIAGSGVSHFDMRFLRVHMPNLVKKCAYYQYDIGNVRRFMALAGRPDLIPEDGDSSTKTHRAIDDARQHAREARAFMAIFGSI